MRSSFRTYQVAASGPDVHHDTLLSNLAVAAFANPLDGLVGKQLFPVVPVPKQSNRYAILDKSAFLRNEDALRAPRTEARRVEFMVSSAPYFCDNYALASEIALEDLANADDVFALRDNTSQLVVGDLSRAEEIRLANICTSITNLGSGVQLTGAAKWSDFVNSDPLGDINTAHAFIQQRTGLIANTAVLDFDTYKILRRHPDLLDMYKYTASGMLTQDQIGEVLDVQQLLIARGIKENATEGQASSMGTIWGNVCFLAHIEQATGLQTRTFGLRFQWQPDGFPAPIVASTRREDGAGTRNVEIIQAEHFQDEVVVARDLAYLIQNTL